jgi:hypothetical protein
MLRFLKATVFFVGGLALFSWGGVRWVERGFPFPSRYSPPNGGEFLWFIVFGLALAAIGLFQFMERGVPEATPSKCPACGEKILQRRWAIRFDCPGCHIGLRFRPVYFRVLYCMSLLLLWSGVDALGLRGYGHLAVVTLAAWPTYLLVLFLSLRMFPAALEATGDVRGLLYGPADMDPIQMSDRQAPPPGSTPSTHRESNEISKAARAPHFVQIVPEVSIAGVLLKVGAFVVVASIVWEAGAAILYQLKPSLVEIRNAPNGFLLRAALGEHAIDFTNLSSEDWACNIALGFGAETAFRASITLAPIETREVAYLDFLPRSVDVDAGVVRSVARDQLWAECRTPSGRSHSGFLR